MEVKTSPCSLFMMEGSRHRCGPGFSTRTATVLGDQCWAGWTSWRANHAFHRTTWRLFDYQKPPRRASLPLFLRFTRGGQKVKEPTYPQHLKIFYSLWEFEDFVYFSQFVLIFLQSLWQSISLICQEIITIRETMLNFSKSKWQIIVSRFYFIFILLIILNGHYSSIVT